MSTTLKCSCYLRKAYDSIPRQAMWKVLAKYGVPQVMINLLRSLHEGMVGQVMVSGERTPQILVNSGLRQRCMKFVQPIFQLGY